MKLTRTSFFFVLFSFASVSFFPTVSYAHELTANQNAEFTRLHANRALSERIYSEKDKKRPPLHNPNLNSQDGFDESLHKRKIKQIQRRKESLKEESVPTQSHNL